MSTDKHHKPTDLGERLAAVEQRIRSTEARLRILEACSGEQAERLTALETGHKTLAESMKEVRAELKALREDADAIKATLVGLGAGVHVVNGRIEKLERRLAGWWALVFVVVEWGPSIAKGLRSLAFGG